MFFALTEALMARSAQYSTPFYFKADSSRTDSSSNTCSLTMPSIDTSFTHLTQYNQSEAPVTWNISAISPSNVPYTITVFVDDDNVTLPSGFTVDSTNAFPFGYILLTINFAELPLSYSNMTYKVEIKPLVWDLPATATTNYTVNLAIRAEPLI